MMISFRDLEEQDLPLLLAWRQDAEVMRYLPSAPKRLTWNMEWNWWLNRRARIDQMVLLAGWRVCAPDQEKRPQNTRPIGVVHCDCVTGEVGLIIGEKGLWGEGVGKEAMRLFLKMLPTYSDVHHGKIGVPSSLWCVVLPENEASLELFCSLGFKYAGEGRNGQARLELKG